MANPRILNHMRVERPCSEDWDRMQGTEQIRFCAHCSKNVHDLTGLDRREAVRLVLRSKGRICLRLRRNEAGEPVFRQPSQQLHAIARRTSRWAAGAFTAVIGLSAGAYAQTPATGTGEISRPVDGRGLPLYLSGSNNAWLAGTVMDPNGAVIPGAQVTVINEHTNEVQTSTTDEDGRYRFPANNRDTYTVSVEEIGFGYKVLNCVRLNATETTRVDIEMEVNGEVTTVGGGGVDYQQPLVMAAFENDLDKVKELLRSGEDVNEREDDGTTALDLAVSHGNLDMIQWLLSRGANALATHTNGENALFWLTEDNAVPTLELLLRSGLAIDHADSEGNTPLIHFASYGSYVVVAALIDHGANVNAANHEGRTALMEASSNGSKEAVTNLLAAGAIFGLRDANGDEALGLATEHDQYDIADVLRDAGAVDRVKAQPTPQKSYDPNERPVEP